MTGVSIKQSPIDGFVIERNSDKTAVIASSVNGVTSFGDFGSYARVNIRIAANVADAETITLDGQVYEFDTALTPTITAGNTRVDVTSAVTPAAATTALVASINANSTRNHRAIKVSDNHVIVFRDTQGTYTAACAETMGGTNNVIESAFSGGAAPAVGRFAAISRVPTATEIAIGNIVIPLGFTPRQAIVQARVTATGAPKYFTSTVTLNATDNTVVVTNTGATQIDANDTVFFMIWG